MNVSISKTKKVVIAIERFIYSVLSQFQSKLEGNYAIETLSDENS